MRQLRQLRHRAARLTVSPLSVKMSINCALPRLSVNTPRFAPRHRPSNMPGKKPGCHAATVGRFKKQAAARSLAKAICLCAAVVTTRERGKRANCAARIRPCPRGARNAMPLARFAWTMRQPSLARRYSEGFYADAATWRLGSSRIIARQSAARWTIWRELCN